MTVNQNPQKAPEKALPAPGIPNLREAKKAQAQAGKAPAAEKADAAVAQAR